MVDHHIRTRSTTRRSRAGRDRGGPIADLPAPSPTDRHKRNLDRPAGDQVGDEDDQHEDVVEDQLSIVDDARFGSGKVVDFLLTL